jgi:hypothetical protein
MSAMNTTFLSMIIAASSVMNNSVNSPIPTTAYTLIKKEKSICLSGREITLSGNRTTRELKAEFLVNAGASTVLKVIKDEQYAKSWMQSVREFSTLHRLNENDWYAYIQYNIPWPLNNQDCIIRYRCVQYENGRKYILTMSGAPDYLPEKTGVERISHLCGSWTITTVGNSECRVVYTIYSEQQPKYPRWATDPIIQRNLINTLASMKELSQNIR